MKKAAFALLLLAGMCLFGALGIWQVERLAWKRDLIARTDLRLAAAPVPAPAPPQWPALTPASAYTRVTVRGSYITGKDTLVWASTRYGRGFWVMTPMATDQGFNILVNRGFITPEQAPSLTVPGGPLAITGLLRLSEPRGSLLQRNRAGEDRWYSRDVQAIAARRGLADVAPYFIDADAGPAGGPIGGLTVVHFRNPHLQYALTWFSLALICAGGLGLLFLRREDSKPD